jgi:hypothetical protein
MKPAGCLDITLTKAGQFILSESLTENGYGQKLGKEITRAFDEARESPTQL